MNNKERLVTTAALVIIATLATIAIYSNRKLTLRETTAGKFSELSSPRLERNKSDSVIDYRQLNGDTVAHLRQYCAGHKVELYHKGGDRQLRKHGLLTYIWMASPHHHLFYCATPKCASTTWKKYILKDLGIKTVGGVHK